MDEPTNTADAPANARPGIFEYAGVHGTGDAARAQDRQARLERIREALFVAVVSAHMSQAPSSYLTFDESCSAVAAHRFAVSALAEWERLDAEAAEGKDKP